ncbi:hypothetical protein AGLY_008230 [Aphis glycines]|uniref:Uncharacterized protein n=1 Tax=Aphis glycines TaxID=307491 RepID=A0A6G0TLF8_APHGL|nr:hypothetical protein AGLY_008230 [Aphis glycines]
MTRKLLTTKSYKLRHLQYNPKIPNFDILTTDHSSTKFHLIHLCHSQNQQPIVNSIVVRRSEFSLSKLDEGVGKIKNSTEILCSMCSKKKKDKTKNILRQKRGGHKEFCKIKEKYNKYIENQFKTKHLIFILSSHYTVSGLCFILKTPVKKINKHLKYHKIIEETSAVNLTNRMNNMFNNHIIDIADVDECLPKI